MIDLMVRGVLVLIGLATVITVAWNLCATERPVSVAELSQVKPKLPPSAALGMQSCAAAGCHGNPNAESLYKADAMDVWKSSFTHWNAVDPHRKAYSGLLSDKAVRMAALLKAGPGGTVLPAHEDVRCLACHTNPTLAVKGSKELRSEGVSCEACHSNAGDWRTEHTTWNTQTRNASIAKTHFLDLVHDDQRARLCASCHVGAPASDESPVRDMNHDMIAAGHPELNKNYFILMEHLSPHWRDKTGRTKMEIDTETIDALGKLANDRRQRNRNHDRRTPWPEFADQSCGKCHHGLKFGNGH